MKATFFTIGRLLERRVWGVAKVKWAIVRIQVPPRGTDNVRIAAPDPKGQSWLDFQITFRFNFNDPALAITIAALSLAAVLSFVVSVSGVKRGRINVYGAVVGWLLFVLFVAVAGGVFATRAIEREGQTGLI